MLRFLINAISSGLGFSKSESKGTLFLIFVIISVYLIVYLLKPNAGNTQMVGEDQKKALADWVSEVERSYQLSTDSLENENRKKTPYSFAWEKDEPSFNAYEKKLTREKKKVAETESIEPKDINIANAEDLREIKGIGQIYSERIIKYRELLGGFSHMDQLEDVYGFSSELVDKVKERFEIRSDVKPLDLNTDSAKVLASHPYISYDLAWVLINYKKQNGAIDGIEDLKKIKAIDDSLLQKLKPYLR